ncbi:MAG: 4-hydroxy-tetrahydrodipicolinate reductase, partial [Lachnospiraceae bacterium]|nr:4-hydroxy-tetrahydrodipicolinate reductase [Lachnospiraceae bacterium]
MTKIILIGCNGRMGQIITGIVAEDTDVEIVAGIDPFGGQKNDYPVYAEISACKEEADAIIDFSSANEIEQRIDYAVERKLPLVECSTGLSEEQTGYLLRAGDRVAVLRSANMSLGVNLLLQLVKEAAKRLSGEGFDIEIVEKHHNQKLDAPSGTALA